MKRIVCISLILSSFCLSSCATLKGDIAKDKALTAANKKASAMGLKNGSACKYIGFIGDNSENKAIQNGGIRMKLFSVKDVGGFIKKCTYAYGR